MPPGGIQQHAGAEDVRVGEICGESAPGPDGFRGEIYHRVKMMLQHQHLHQIRVRDIGLEKLVPLTVTLGQPRDIRDIPGGGERIHIRHELRVVMLQDVADEVAADEIRSRR